MELTGEQKKGHSRDEESLWVMTPDFLLSDERTITKDKNKMRKRVNDTLINTP